MRKTSTRTTAKSTVTILRPSEEDYTLNVPKNASVEEVLEMAEISITAGQTLMCNGEIVEMNSVIEDGDKLLIIGKKQGGSEEEPQEESDTVAEPAEFNPEDEPVLDEEEASTTPVLDTEVAQ